MQDLQKNLKRLRVLRKLREAEQARLAAELHGCESRMRVSREAADAAQKFLEGDLSMGGLLVEPALREIDRNARIVEQERGRIAEISQRSIHSKSIKDALAEKENRVAAHLDKLETDEALMETVATWPAIVGPPGDDDDP